MIKIARMLTLLTSLSFIFTNSMAQDFTFPTTISDEAQKAGATLVRSEDPLPKSDDMSGWKDLQDQNEDPAPGQLLQAPGVVAGRSQPEGQRQEDGPRRHIDPEILEEVPPACFVIPGTEEAHYVLTVEHLHEKISLATGPEQQVPG